MKLINEKTEKYLKYAEFLNARKPVITWCRTTLNNYLTKNDPSIEEVEHILDYLASPDSVKLTKLSYPDARKNAEKWTNKLMRKGEHIKETKKDTKVVLDFKDGFKIVQLIGKNAYDREGFLMRHCVASYFGKNVEIYSLRDKENMPHCTMEKDQQIKGKGNGNIHPKYVGYVVKFLEYAGMTVGDSEMAHLGYINVEKFKDHLSKNMKLFDGKYIPEDQKLIGKDGEEFASLDLLDVKPLIKETIDSELKINFNLPTFIPLSVDFLFKFTKTKDEFVQVASGYFSKLAASGYFSKLAASGDSSKLAASGYSSQLAASGHSSKLAASGDSSKLAASGDYSQLAASGDYSQLAASGDSSKLAASGHSSKLAASGDSSKLAMEGKDSVGANIGINGMIKGVKGDWITLAEYDRNNNWKPICVKSVKIDGKKIKENTWYMLKNKKFVEVKL